MKRKGKKEVWRREGDGGMRGGGGLRSKIDGSLIIKCFTLIDSEAGLKRSNSIANVKTLMLFFPFFFCVYINR